MRACATLIGTRGGVRLGDVPFISDSARAGCPNGVANQACWYLGLAAQTPTMLRYLPVALLLAAVPALAQVDRRAAQVDRLFAQWASAETPGAAVAVVEDGELVLARGYGRANLEYEVMITPQTPFHVASVSKQFTAFAIAMLAEQGKLSLDDDIRQHLPEIPDFGHRITIRHLVHHTSGIRDQWELLVMAGWRIDDVITQEQILSLLRHQRELNFEPGTEHLYSNSGYTLLAEIVSRVTGLRFADWTRQHIFAPLGMTSTHFHDDHRRIVPNRAYSYAPEGSGFRHAPLNYATVGATSLFTTVEDLARWMLNFETMRVGSAAVHAQMRQRGVLVSGDTLSYAFALSHYRHRGEAALQHSGSDAGYRSVLIYLPARRLGVVVLSNLATFDPVGMAARVLDVYLGLNPEALPSSPGTLVEAVPVSGRVLAELAGEYGVEGGGRLDVVVRQGMLYVRMAGGEAVPAFSVGDDAFVLAGGSRLQFNRGDDGQVSHLVARFGARVVVAWRLPPVDPARLAEYVGEYHSPELGTTYFVVVREGALVAEHRRHPPASLIMVGEDTFAGDRWGMGSLRFTRGADGRIDGLLLSGSRARNVRFERVGQ